MKVAVVGAGVSGLSSVWALNEYSSHQVHLFEPLAWIGGHANTVNFTPPTCASPLSAPKTKVDTGFIVFNKVTYPNFLRFLQLTKVEILNSDMSFSVTRFLNGVYGGFEWAGGSPAALFCQATNLLNPGHWRMVWDIIRFNQQSVDYLRQCKLKPQKGAQMSIGEWLDQRGYSHSFRNNYLIPMTASIWSTAPETALNSFPALTLLRFMHNHHLLQILDRPQWLTIKDGSHSYVNRILSKLPTDRIHQGHDKGEITSAYVDPKSGKWTLTTADGHSSSGWDKVIFACHADQTVAILKAGREKAAMSVELEKAMRVLGRFEFSENSAVLHSDVRLMPVRREAWSAWNFLAEAKGATDVDRVSLTYWMNLLQSLPEEKFGPVLVTLNPTTDPESPYTPRAELVLRKQAYTHPLYTPQSVLAQQELKEYQDVQGAFFAGAWTNYGFHEDGFSSGLRAADGMQGVYLPFDVKHAERGVPKTKQLGCRVAESLDSVAKIRVVAWPVHLALVVVYHLLALVDMCLSLLEVRRAWRKEVATVKRNLGDSVTTTTTPSKKLSKSD